MITGKPDYMNCSSEFIGGLIETVSIALMENFPNIKVDRFEVEQVIDALKILRPNVVEIDMFDAILMMVSGRWQEASQILLRVVEMRPKVGYVKGLLAFSLLSMGDLSWRHIANEALADDPGNKQTAALVRALEVKDSVDCAIRNHRPGQRLVIPALLPESGASVDELASDASRSCESISESESQAFSTGAFLRA